MSVRGIYGVLLDGLWAMTGYERLGVNGRTMHGMDMA
jgi:hypothetical protein